MNEKFVSLNNSSRYDDDKFKFVSLYDTSKKIITKTYFATYFAINFFFFVLSTTTSLFDTLDNNILV